MHGLDVVLTCKDQKQGGEIILFPYSVKVSSIKTISG